MLCTVLRDFRESVVTLYQTKVANTTKRNSKCWYMYVHELATKCALNIRKLATYITRKMKLHRIWKIKTADTHDFVG